MLRPSHTVLLTVVCPCRHLTPEMCSPSGTLPVVCWEIRITGLGRVGVGKALIYSICCFPWCKDSHPGQCQATDGQPLKGSWAARLSVASTTRRHKWNCGKVQVLAFLRSFACRPISVWVACLPCWCWCCHRRECRPKGGRAVLSKLSRKLVTFLRFVFLVTRNSHRRKLRKYRKT